MRPYFEKSHHKKGLVEWLKCRPKTAKNKNKKIK
jgi:hypothetical protein